MKVTIFAAITLLTLLLTAHVTAKAGWFAVKKPDGPLPMKTLHVRNAGELQQVMNTDAARNYRAGVGGNWKLTMLYR